MCKSKSSKKSQTSNPAMYVMQAGALVWAIMKDEKGEDVHLPPRPLTRDVTYHENWFYGSGHCDCGCEEEIYVFGHKAPQIAQTSIHAKDVIKTTYRNLYGEEYQEAS